MIDRLIEKIRITQNPTVVGLDPTLSMIPEMLKRQKFEEHGKTPKAVTEMFVAFNREIIDAVFDLIPAVKPQIAMYEQYGIDGIEAYMQTTRYAKEKGLIVIGDIKRGDIASTAEAYAGHLAGVQIEDTWFDPWQEDAVTLNPYMGSDSVEPFLRPCRERDKGLFILVKTSNPGGSELQDLMTGKEPLYSRVADLVCKWGELAMGNKGYSKVGAVVGATYREQGVTLRKQMPHTFFLVPGYGAQGGKAEDLRGYFDKDGLGSIVNSSRGITAAWTKSKEFSPDEFAQAARQAVIDMKTDLQRVML